MKERGKKYRFVSSLIVLSLVFSVCVTSYAAERTISVEGLLFAAGSVTSDAATLTVADALVITAQPESRRIAEDGRVSFTVKAEGSGIIYQWQEKSSGSFDWTDIEGAQADILTFTAAAERAFRR